MTALLALLKLAWPYMLVAALAGAAGGYFTHGFDSIVLNRQKAAMAAYKQQVADEDAKASKAAEEAIQTQLDIRKAVDANNSKVMADLQRQKDEAASHYDADRSLIRGLLNAASANPAPKSDPLPEGQGGSTVTGAGGAHGAEQVVELCTATKEEGQRNADRLDALIAQIKPQLEP